MEEALTHFGEALRIDPENIWAREGFVTALKARYRVYRVVLGAVFFLQRLRRPVRITVMVVVYLAMRGLLALGEARPELRWIAGPLFMATAMAIFVWLGGPLFDALILFHPLGRHAIAPRRVRRAVFWMGIVLTMIGAGILWLTDAPGLVDMIWFGASGLSIPIALALLARDPTERRSLSAFAILLGVALLAVIGAATAATDPLTAMNLSAIAVLVGLVAAVGSMVLSPWLAERAERGRASFGRR